MMKTLLQKLYNGELCPIEQIVSKETAYRPVNRQITEAMGVWRKRLDESEYKELGVGGFAEPSRSSRRNGPGCII
ncbi:hypothetical protein EHV15_33800 [Paenibacillus oralis]|uniref:Uncharacterized protein n=1 Tax=Paenibacillus oralis TaxID=2490856 RepID=A0A3P3T965_9BACL|nr:DUF6809 family protein [Paenibacillus oralis]RRJ54586.1 hypothetical protein EHV15_33800 [Paenibacillus oralis]